MGIEHLGRDEGVGVTGAPTLLPHVRFEHAGAARERHLLRRDALLTSECYDCLVDTRLVWLP
jgi:hypothetical protein